MKDKDKRIEAMYHLESCFYGEGNGADKPKGWNEAHMVAAHYLIQSMFNGPKPANYDQIMAEVARLDAIDEANNAIHVAKQ